VNGSNGGIADVRLSLVDARRLSRTPIVREKGRLDLKVSDLGAVQLKNIAEPVRVNSLEVGQPRQAKPPPSMTWGNAQCSAPAEQPARFAARPTFGLGLTATIRLCTD
jgi:hypothetical protein